VLYLCGSLNYTGTDNLGGDHGDLRRVQPAFFTTVPRLLEKVYERLFNKGLELTGVKKSLFFWALKLTNDHEIDVPYTGFRALQHKIADKLIYSKWREALGGNIKGIVIGAAPCPVKVARTFCCAGIPIREGYGLTESSPGLVFSRFDKGGALLGTVGMALDNVEIMIDSSDGNYREGEGEILAAGPNIMVGYYNKPDKTAETIREMDGKRWLLTGDIGTMVKGPNGKPFLKITDRKKELFKTSGGKYVAPAPIESRFKENFLIEQIMLVGDNEKFVAALIVPATEALKDWCQTNNVAWDNDTLKNPKVIARYQEIADRYNPDFSHIEQVKRMVLVNASWDVVKEDGTEAELTPTMKLKRRVILKKHKIDIDSIYGEKES
jgi:long-chain acyl-CoA synthetase